MVNKQKTIQQKNRFDLDGCTTTMKAVVTNGNGGYDELEYRDVPVPTLASGEVLLQVLAAGVNNTEINTRLGWYSNKVTAGTEDLSAAEKEKAKEKADGGWNEATPFPFIQGTDCCGRIISVAPGGDESTLGLRVLVRAYMRSSGWDEPVFPNLISYIENAEIRPLLAKTFPLKRIVDAQREFTEKKHVGKFVLIPPSLDDQQQALFGAKP